MSLDQKVLEWTPRQAATHSRKKRRSTSGVVVASPGQIRARSAHPDSPMKYIHGPRANTWATVKCELMGYESRYHRGLEHKVSLRSDFRLMADEWYEATMVMSDTNAASMHPTYQRIIGMGRDALPFIFEELRGGKGGWFWALTAITGEDPTVRGQTTKESKAAWIKWAEEHGY